MRELNTCQEQIGKSLEEIFQLITYPSFRTSKKSLTLKSGMQTVRGYMIIYHPAQNAATQKDKKIRRINQITNQSGFFMLFFYVSGMER